MCSGVLFICFLFHFLFRFVAQVALPWGRFHSNTFALLHKILPSQKKANGGPCLGGPILGRRPCLRLVLPGHRRRSRGSGCPFGGKAISIDFGRHRTLQPHDFGAGMAFAAHPQHVPNVARSFPLIPSCRGSSKRPTSGN